jgi:methionine synthase I (cobalamin-dependent)
MSNTLTANRIFTHGPDSDLRELNLAGVRLARAAAGTAPVLGDMGSCGKLLQPFGPLTEAEAHAAFLEQAQLLAEGGVDGFIVETMTDIREAVCALRACRVAADLPVIVTLTYRTARDGGRTLMGNRTADCVRQLEAAGAAAVGANCGEIDPLELAAIIAAMRALTSLPILAKPNAGKPRVESGRLIYDLPVAEFVDGQSACIRSGATLVGGCCGTSPEYIAALARAIRPAEH